jgi:hypothetical protein
MIRAFVLSILMAATAAPVLAQQVRISRTDCSRLVQHQPSADVAYQPGVDARGRPVAPADLPGGVQVKPRTEFTIDIEVDLQRRFGVPTNPNLYQPKANVGSITVKGDKAYFDGQPLTDQTQEALAAYCAAELKKK